MRLYKRDATIETGKMRDYVTYQEATQTSDGEGGYTKTWASVKQIWAQITPMKDTRLLEAASVKFVGAFMFRMRYDTELQPSGRFTYEGVTYTIHSVNDIEKLHRYMDALCYTQE